MINIKRKISTFTLLIVTFVAFLGVICPMTAGGDIMSSHDNCTPSVVSLSSGEHGDMAECMSGKLGFLANLLVSMPQQEVLLLLLAVITVLSIIAGLVKVRLGDTILKVRLRSLLSSYYGKVKIQYFQNYFHWLNTVQRPVSIA